MIKDNIVQKRCKKIKHECGAPLKVLHTLGERTLDASHCINGTFFITTIMSNEIIVFDIYFLQLNCNQIEVSHIYFLQTIVTKSLLFQNLIFEHT